MYVSNQMHAKLHLDYIADPYFIIENVKSGKITSTWTCEQLVEILFI